MKYCLHVHSTFVYRNTRPGLVVSFAAFAIWCEQIRRKKNNAAIILVALFFMYTVLHDYHKSVLLIPEKQLTYTEICTMPHYTQTVDTFHMLSGNINIFNFVFNYKANNEFQMCVA